MRYRSDLMPHQLDAINLMKEKQQLAVLLKMGLGKTAITLTALADLNVRRALVLAPMMVVETDTWGVEAREWDHLAKRTGVVPICGTPKQRRSQLEGSLTVKTRIDVISYENAIWLTDEFDDLAAEYDAIVFDELSKLKHPGTSRFRRLRTRAAQIPIRYGLTGSPVGNHLLDLWGEMFMVAGEKPLGPRFVDYREENFEATDYEQRVWRVKPGREPLIHERVKPYAFSISEEVAAKRLPKVVVNPLRLRLPPVVLRMEAQLARECKAELASGEDLLALNASAKAQKARQLASGAVYLDGGERWEEIHTVKLDALDTILELAQGEPVLCFYWFQHELARLKKRFPFAKEATDPRSLTAWNARGVELLLAHPQSAGHGLNLQHGGSTVVWLALPWSFELWSQGNGRLARPGQKAPFVTANVLLAGDADEAVLQVLREKGRVERDLTTAVELT